MIAGTFGDMAAVDAARHAQLATAAALRVGVVCLLARLFRLSVPVKLISDSVPTGFEAARARQLPSRSFRRCLV
jgi:sulfate permease, SulP family